METTAKPNSNVSIPSFADYTEDRKYLKNVSPRTLAWFGDVWKAFGPHLEPLLTSGDNFSVGLRAGITALLAKGVRPISVNSYLTGVRAYLNWLHVGGFLKEKPKVQLLNCAQKVIATFSSEHIHSLVFFKPKGRNQIRAHMICCLLLDTGLRIAEALGIRREDIDLDNMLIRVTGKGNKQRMVPISIELRKLLFQWSKNCPRDFVFGTRSGTQMTQRNVQRDIKQLCGRLGVTGVRCSPHTFRHTFAVSYLRAGGNLFYLSKILGHTSIKTTERYLQSVQVDDLQAVHDRLSLLSKRG